MTVDFVIPVRRLYTLERLLWSLSRNSQRPDTVTLVSNELSADSLPTFGLPVRLVRFSSSQYAVGELDAALRRNIGIWSSKASHIVTFDDDQLAPRNLVASIESIFKKRPFFWGHHRFLEFGSYTVDQILALPAEAGRSRENPPNAWHSWRSAYGGLFGCQREIIMDIGGFDMMFSGRHGGEDQNLGRRLASQHDHSDAIFVYEPPFAWHPESNTIWDPTLTSNQCSGTHDLQPGLVENVPAQVCRNCPFYHVADREILRPNLGIRFAPQKVEIHELPLIPESSRSLLKAFLACRHSLTLDHASGFLQSAYDHYVSTVSPPDFAASLVTSAFLYELCERLGPQSILDMGSGFSSYVLRLYAAHKTSVRVLTVDDDPDWLDRTAVFLDHYGVSSQDLMSWNDLQRHPPTPFELVFHDLGSMATRLKMLPAALNLCRIGGIVVLDDMHKEEYAPQAEQILIAAGFQAIDLREETLDHFGRFCWIASKKCE